MHLLSRSHPPDPRPPRAGVLSASSYRDKTTSGELKISFFPTGEIEGRSLLLVDDILDTGQTMSRLKAEFLARGASEVATCVFLDKPSRRAVELDADFKVLEVDDLFVVGYGLDFAGRYRNLPYVGVLRPELYGAAGGSEPGADRLPRRDELHGHVRRVGRTGGARLDEYLCLQYSGLSKGFVRQEIAAGRVLLDGQETKPASGCGRTRWSSATLDWERAPASADRTRRRDPGPPRRRQRPRRGQARRPRGRAGALDA